LTAVRELYIDTERPVELSGLAFDVFELEDADDEEVKLQCNTAYVFSQALNYASSLIRFADPSDVSNSRTEWFNLRDRVLQDRVQRYSVLVGVILMKVMSRNTSLITSF
jgi:hypothetical protein